MSGRGSSKVMIARREDREARSLPIACLALALALAPVRVGLAAPGEGLLPGSAPAETSTGTASLFADPRLEALEEARDDPPPWERGWFWALVSGVVVSSAVGAVVGARSGDRCFCLTPEGTPCASCD